MKTAYAAWRVTLGWQYGLMKSALRPLMAAAVLGMSMLGFAQAQGVTTVNPNLGYLRRIDPITDVNTSYVLMLEINDTDGYTGIRFRCDDDGKLNPWGIFFGKNEIMPYDSPDEDGHLWPSIVVRMGTDAPFSVPDTDVYSITEQTTDIGFDGKTFDRMVAGLLAGKKMVIRFDGEHLRQPLTYTFSAQGFPTAWNGIKACK